MLLKFKSNENEQSNLHYNCYYTSNINYNSVNNNKTK